MKEGVSLKNKLLCLGLLASSVQAFSAESVTYLSCPGFDERAPDLQVILDKSNGTASLQSPSMGSGLNFTVPASFGPDRVTWKKDTGSFKNTYSVDRETLVFERRTYSERTSNTDVTKANCKMIPKNKKNKF